MSRKQVGAESAPCWNPKPLLLTGTVGAADKRPTRLMIRAYTGGLIRPAGWGAVLIDLAGLSLPDSLPILDNHETALAAVIGRGRPVVQRGELIVAVAVAPGPVGERVVELLRVDVRLQASVGVEPIEVRDLRPRERITINGREHTVPPGGATLVARGALREVSIVAVGADSSTEVSLAARGAAQKEQTVNSNTTATPLPTDPDPVTAERARIKELREICGTDYPTILARATDEGWTPDECRRHVLAELRASRPRAPGLASARPDVPARDLLAAAALLAAGAPGVDRLYGEHVAEAAAGLRVRGWRDLAVACCRARGVEPPRGETDLIRAASGGGLSTSDLGAVVADALNRQLLDSWQATPATWADVAKVIPAANFHPMRLLRLGASGHYERVAPGGELKHGTLGAQKLEVAPDTYGRIIGIDRRDIINDDLGLLAGGLADELARIAANAVNDLVWAEFTDNTTFFTTAKGNRLTGAGSALSVDSVASAVRVLRQAKDTNGNLVGAAPYALVVPAALEFRARALLTSVTLARNTSSADNLPEGSPIPRDLRLVVEPRLDGDSDKRWYLTAAPRLGLLLVAFLNGRLTPIIEVENSFETLGLHLRAFHDFGAALGDSAMGVCANGQ